MRIDNPPSPRFRKVGTTRNRGGEWGDLKPIFKLNIEYLPSICQGEQSHAINGNHDSL